MRKLPILFTPILALSFAVSPVSPDFGNHSLFETSQAQASQIKVVVNDEVVTSYAIARRVAFLRLQRKSGGLQNKALEELTEEALKRDAIRKAGFRIPESQVNSAFANFARNNKLSTSKLTQILNQSGVTADHFKDFIRVQIGWSQLVQSRARGQNQLMSEQDVVAKMLEQGGQKPTSTEYMLQQVIFVIPESKRRSQLKSRRAEANNMRGRVTGCDGTKALASQVRDVTVRDLGRVLELELPERWAKDVSGLSEGETTRVKDTERGVEFLIVCRARSVSDDRVAQLQFSTEALDSSGGDIGQEYLEELRKSAKIRRQ